MAMEEHARVIIDVILKQDKAGFKYLKDELKKIPKGYKAAADSMRKATNIMSKQGISSDMIKKGLINFRETLGKNNIKLDESKGFVNKLTGAIVKQATISKIATKSIGMVKGTAKDLAIAEANVTKVMRSQGRTVSDIRASWSRYTENMGAYNHVVTKGGNIIDKTSGKIQKMGAVASTVSRHSLRQFRGEFLSLMFIGQGLAGVFSSLMQPIWEITGLFDVWRATLITVLGPLLIPLAMIMIRVMKAMMGLSPETKNMIAGFVLIGFILAKILALATPILILIHTLGGFSEVWAGLSGMFKMGAGAKGIFNLSGQLGNVLTILGKMVGVFQIIIGAVNIVSGIILKQVWPVVKGILMVVAGILLFFGGWIAAIGIGLGFLVIFANKIGYVRSIVLRVATSFVAIYETMLNIQKLVGRLFGGKKEISWEVSKKMAEASKESWDAGWGKPEMMAKGGIVSKPTIAMIGEKGPEAVIPLSGGEGMGYNPTINVNVYGGLGDNDIDMVVRKVNERLRSDIMGYGI